MIIRIFTTCIVLFLSISLVGQVDVRKQFEFAAEQYLRMLASHPDQTQSPQSSNPDGTPNNRSSDWWCSGFFPGSLWYIYEFTKEKKDQLVQRQKKINDTMLLLDKMKSNLIF